MKPGVLKDIAGQQLQPRGGFELTVSSGVLPMSTTKSQMRPDSALQNMRRPRTSRTMYIPPAERVAPACEEDQHGTGPERARLQR